MLDTRPSSSLASDWRRYFNSELLSDVCLLVGDMRIPAHRVVLAARCDFFARIDNSEDVPALVEFAQAAPMDTAVRAGERG